MATRFVALCGSLRRESVNRRLLEATRELGAEAGIEILEAEHREFPLYDADTQAEGFPSAVLRAGELIRSADGILLVSPEYNYSVPGVLKNAIDWLSRLPEQPFSNKATGIMGASPGAVGTARMQYHLRQILVFLNAFPVNRPQVMVGNAGERFDDEGRLVDQGTRDQVIKLLKSVQDLGRRLASD